ncbi:response regulator receiver domain protein (CheY-like) [Pedobacter sp. BAL39]|uniref:sensor histidine kinase n=1 Tax=Pedobacter sp. BAL39 TaxID=391596 RepID=UPI000155959A|nr:ATP-binding protein [Pedobacter sp. BAL39]EDM38544.1 response regulator receiver domain protein (CheY-like) [Pedobacter sp. BAL39]
MFYNRFTFRLLLRLLLINLLGFLFIHLIRTTQLWFTITGLGIMLLAALISLYHYINEIRQDIKRFILAVKTRDSTLNFRNKATSGSFPELYESFNDIIKTQKDIQLEKDSMFQLIRTILEQVPVGVIVIKNEEQEANNAEIVFFNQAATNLLGIPAYKYWHRVAQHLPEFASEIAAIGRGGKRFMELKIQDKLIQLSTEVMPLNLYLKDYTIVSFQNIKDEIEQKESEAWNRLIGVISHEILNSITPISSLSDTVNSMIATKTSLNQEDLEDLKPAIQTIKRRSEGLLDFVKDYRLIAELPTPQLDYHTIGEILQHIKILMQPFASGRNIILRVEQTSSKITIQVDLKLIEQALINLVTNSIYALEGQDHPTIEISYKLDQNKVHLEVADNGRGIEPELLEKIFVPFFTTRKNGSGIGLTITRNIMKMHHGSLEVNSIPFEKTVFSLIFRYQ